MRRPALSAVRAMQIINRLAASPERAFTMSEIMRDTDINVGSCHALLTALTEQGYLRRERDKKVYTLGPALAAVGQAAFVSLPPIARARREAAELMQRIGHPVLLTGVAGDEIIAIFSCAVDPAHEGGLRVGQRVPFAPPMGGPFVAWSSAVVVEDWLARGPSADEALREDWRQALMLVKQRGYQVTLRPPAPELTTLMSEISQGRAPRAVEQDWDRYLAAADRRLLQPETIEPEALYPVVMIAAPVFDEKAGTTYSLCVTGFESDVTGAQVELLAKELVQSCVRIMRDADF